LEAIHNPINCIWTEKRSQTGIGLLAVTLPLALRLVGEVQQASCTAKPIIRAGPPQRQPSRRPKPGFPIGPLPTPSKCGCPKRFEDNHNLPNEFAVEFAQCFGGSTSQGLDVEDLQWHLCLPTDAHRLKAGNGIHTNQGGPGTNWNAYWRQFFERVGPGGCTPDLVLQEFTWLLDNIFPKQFKRAVRCKDGNAPTGMPFPVRPQ
jgi:hypothetical protein